MGQNHYLRLVVVLNAHGEDIDADDEGDEEVQVVAGAQCVDGQTYGREVCVVRPLLGLWSTKPKCMGQDDTMREKREEL